MQSLNQFKRLKLLLLILVSCSASAAPPEGLSSWSFSYCETPAIQEREQCTPFSAELRILYLDGEICGMITESWLSKSPSAAFYSDDFGESGRVKFADSFQKNEKDFGLASLKFSETEAEWTVLKSPQGGLVGDASTLQQNKQSMLKPATCIEAKKIWGPFPVQ